MGLGGGLIRRAVTHCMSDDTAVPMIATNTLFKNSITISAPGTLYN